ncbi:tripartite ATP-independent transporter DctM subunit [Caldalkalibacillus uzonensis]|uniref:Tripartite ATP-independent transporter DctM subunit n=1 Tax=Caldalkalibacillus uzonensis TaxID=353224 RepID=A0ABU0CNC5_9BACI|nr:TRAP transporter large permease subunit [Caldalkalibacillus uzonensis]MDQ0337913.1 tripartite ATP-independent transporter DctM subunit [Caldalkalibacillus uzonensis]
MSLEILFLIFMFIGLMVGLATGHPLAFVLGGLAVIFGLIGWGPQTLNVFVNGVFGAMNNYTLVAIPLFTLMANLLARSYIAEGLFESLRYLLGRVRGGIALAVILVSTIFAATTGVVGASVVTMGLLGIHVLLKYSYDQRLSTGVVAAGGTLGILIPPSIMLVIMGAQSQVSVGDLFKASLIPGLLLAFAYCLYVLFICWRKPEYGPALSAEEAAAVPIKQRIKGSLVNMIPPIILVVAVLGSVFSGVATPTEASGVGAFVALLMTMVYRKFSFNMLSEAVYDTAKTTAMVLIILVGANAFASMFLALSGDQLIQGLVEAFGLNAWGVFILMLMVTFVLGMFIDWIGIVMIVFPIFLPLLHAYDFNMLWVVTCIALMLQTSFLTPPFGYSLFYIKGIVPPSVKLSTIYKGVLPFVVIILLVLAVAIIFPELILWLPDVLKN